MGMLDGMLQGFLANPNFQNQIHAMFESMLSDPALKEQLVHIKAWAADVTARLDRIERRLNINATAAATEAGLAGVLADPEINVRHQALSSKFMNVPVVEHENHG